MTTLINPYRFAAGAAPGGPDGLTDYVTLTIPAGAVASNLTDYPVYVDLSSLLPAFWAGVQADGGDIRVTLDDGSTRCPVEVVFIDTGTDTGEMHFLAPSVLTASDNVFRIYYGGTGLSQPGVGTAYGRNAVWADYAAVFHMQENPAGTAPQIVDSTGNGNDGTSGGSMTSGDSVAGKLAGKAIEFDGINDYITIPDAANLDFTSAYTLSGWMVCTDSAWSTIVAKGVTGDTNENYEMAVVRANPDMAGRHGGTNYSHALVAAPGAATFEHFVRTYSANTIRDYFRGAEDGSTGSIIDISATAGTVRIGRRFTAFENYTQGTIDEVRLAPTALSADRIAAEYANQNDPDTFYLIDNHVEFIAGDEVFYTSVATGDITLPASVEAGDLILILVFARGTITPESGYALEGTSGILSGANGRLGVYSKTAVGGDASATITFDQSVTDRFGLAYLILRGQLATPAVSAIGFSAEDTSKPYATPSATNNGTDRMAISGYINEIAASGTTTLTPPSGFTGATLLSGSGIRLAAAYKRLASGEDIPADEWDSNLSTHDAITATIMVG